MKRLLLALFLAAPVWAADPATPAEAAVRYLEKVRSGELDLAPQKDTAISPATGKDKRKVITERIQRLSKELVAGPLEPGTQSVDGDMATVLVRQAGGFDPARLRVVAVALIQKEGKWLPAPLPGSFENTGLGYDAGRSDRLAKLEAWMMREQVLDLATLRDQSSERLKKEIERKLPKNELRAMTAEQVVKRFLAACAAKDQATALGLLGGLEPELPKDWSTYLAAVDRAFAENPVNSPWRILVTPGVIRTVLSVGNGDRQVGATLAFLDASGESNRPMLPPMTLLKVSLHKNGAGLFRLELPEYFLESTQEEGSGDEEKEDLEILNTLPAAWRRDLPAAKLATSKDASEALLAALRGDAPDSLLGLLDLRGDPAVARLGASRLALVWREVHHPRDLRTLIPLAFHEEGNGAVAAYQIFSSREADRSDLRLFYFVKNADGWLLAPGVRPAEPVQADLTAVKTWADARAPEWTKNWESIVLAGSASLEAVPAGEAPSEESVKAAFEAWSKAIVRGDVPGVIAGTGYLKRDRATTRLLRNLGSELTGAYKNGYHASILGIIRRGPWTGVSARVGKKGDSAATYPLYPLVVTPDGPRVLAEIDLSANGNRTREFLNDATWGRLEADGGAAAAAPLREIYEIHRKNAEADRTPAP